MIDPVSQRIATPLPQATNDKRKGQDLVEKILLGEVKQLQAQVFSEIFNFLGGLSLILTFISLYQMILLFLFYI